MMLSNSTDFVKIETNYLDRIGLKSNIASDQYDLYPSRASVPDGCVC